MLRRFPLMILLLIATIVVNVVLINVRMPGGLDRRALFAGLLFGQMAALAIWAARGSGIRLFRVSLLVLGSCVVGLVTGGSALLSRSQWSAILVSYALAVYFMAVLIAILRNYSAKRSGIGDTQPTWQVSLIELFGWTILVAIASFVARSMDFGFVRLDNNMLEKAVLLLILPMMLAANIRHDLRDLSQGWALGIVLVAITLVAAYSLRMKEPRIALPLIFGQGGYLVLWFFILGMDRVVREASRLGDRDTTIPAPEDRTENSQELDP